MSARYLPVHVGHDRLAYVVDVDHRRAYPFNEARPGDTFADVIGQLERGAAYYDSTAVDLLPAEHRLQILTALAAR